MHPFTILSRVAPAATLIAVLASCAQDDPAAARSPAARAPGVRPNVVLIVVDTLRRDRVGAYGSPAADRRGGATASTSLSPGVDALAADALRFDQAYAQAPWTTPSVSSMMTSRYPEELGIRERYSAVPEEAVLLPEMLRDAGYDTGAVIANLFCSRRWGFDRGFDVFDDSTATGFEHVTSADVTDRAIAFVDRPRDVPFFLWVHYFDPHFLYVLHEEYAPPTDYRGKITDELPYQHLTKLRESGLTEADVAELRRRYDSEVAYTDREIGRLLEHLRRRGLYDDALVLFTADHGEAFLEHDVLGHGRGLHQELVHVPLLWKDPARPPGVVPDVVELVDVVPTLLDRLDLRRPDGALAGRSLLPLLPGADGGEARPAFFTTERGGPARGVVSGTLKLIERGNPDRRELYDLRADPAEATNLAGVQPENADRLAAVLEDWALRLEEKRMEERVLDLTEAERERLDALGYIR